MDFQCFLCKIQCPDIKSAITHLKKIHLIIDNTMNMRCLVRHKGVICCSKQYKTFASLRKHMMDCVQSTKYNAQSSQQVKSINLILSHSL